jgi:hypothetical protein
VSSLKKKKNLFLKMEVDGDGELLLASEDGKDMGLPQLAFSVSAEKSNDLRKKLEARKALTARYPDTSGQEIPQLRGVHPLTPYHLSS